MTQQKDQPPTIGATIRAAFKFSADAAAIRDALAAHLKTAAPGRASSILSRCYHVLNDMVRALDQLESNLAESHALGRYLQQEQQEEAKCL